jgi:hypothetical protein
MNIFGDYNISFLATLWLTYFFAIACATWRREKISYNSGFFKNYLIGTGTALAASTACAIIMMDDRWDDFLMLVFPLVLFITALTQFVRSPVFPLYLGITLLTPCLVPAYTIIAAEGFDTWFASAWVYVYAGFGLFYHYLLAASSILFYFLQDNLPDLSFPRLEGVRLSRVDFLVYVVQFVIWGIIVYGYAWVHNKWINRR